MVYNVFRQIFNSHSCCRQEPVIQDNLSRCNVKEKQGICLQVFGNFSLPWCSRHIATPSSARRWSVVHSIFWFWVWLRKFPLKTRLWGPRFTVAKTCRFCPWSSSNESVTMSAVTSQSACQPVLRWGRHPGNAPHESVVVMKECQTSWLQRPP